MSADDSKDHKQLDSRPEPKKGQKILTGKPELKPGQRVIGEPLQRSGKNVDAPAKSGKKVLKERK